MLEIKQDLTLKEIVELADVVPYESAISLSKYWLVEVINLLRYVDGTLQNPQGNAHKEISAKIKEIMKKADNGLL